MKIIFGAAAAVCLSSCAATRFDDHLDVMKSAGSLSQAGKSRSFIISDSALGSQRIRYDYLKNFSDYSEYTRDRPEISDTITKNLIGDRLVRSGMGWSKTDVDPEATKFVYRQILGWDMGEIVKKMTICAETNSDKTPAVECATFSELTMFNTHPTRRLVVDNLLAILLTSKWPEKAPTEKYSKHRLEIAQPNEPRRGDGR